MPRSSIVKVFAFSSVERVILSSSSAIFPPEESLVKRSFSEASAAFENPGHRRDFVGVERVYDDVQYLFYFRFEFVVHILL